MTLAQLIARDGEACIWCGQARWLTIEHLLPQSKRGQSREENLALACRACNRSRGSRPIAAFERERLREGKAPATPALCTALERLSRSASARHAAYGARQLELLSPEDDRLSR